MLTCSLCSGAIDVLTNEKVAIKKLTPMAGDEWDAKHTLREIRLMRYFGKHPNASSRLSSASHAHIQFVDCLFAESKHVSCQR